MGIFGFTVSDVRRKKADVERMKGDKNIKGLVKALTYKKGKSARKNPAEAIGWIVRLEAAKALGSLGDVDTAEALSTSTEVFLTYNLKPIREKAVDPLIQALKDEKDLVRWAAAEALGKIQDARAIESLTRLLEDKDSILVSTAIKAIKKIRGSKYK